MADGCSLGKGLFPPVRMPEPWELPKGFLFTYPSPQPEPAGISLLNAIQIELEKIRHG